MATHLGRSPTTGYTIDELLELDGHLLGEAQKNEFFPVPVTKECASKVQMFIDTLLSSPEDSARCVLQLRVLLRLLHGPCFQRKQAICDTIAADEVGIHALLTTLSNFRNFRRIVVGLIKVAKVGWTYSRAFRAALLAEGGVHTLNACDVPGMTKEPFDISVHSPRGEAAEQLLERMGDLSAEDLPRALSSLALAGQGGNPERIARAVLRALLAHQSCPGVTVAALRCIESLCRQGHRDVVEEAVGESAEPVYHALSSMLLGCQRSVVAHQLVTTAILMVKDSPAASRTLFTDEGFLHIAAEVKHLRFPRDATFDPFHPWKEHNAGASLGWLLDHIRMDTLRPPRLGALLVDLSMRLAEPPDDLPERFTVARTVPALRKLFVAHASLRMKVVDVVRLAIRGFKTQGTREALACDIVVSDIFSDLLSFISPALAHSITGQFGESSPEMFVDACAEILHFTTKHNGDAASEIVLPPNVSTILSSHATFPGSQALTLLLEDVAPLLPARGIVEDCLLQMTEDPATFVSSVVQMRTGENWVEGFVELGGVGVVLETLPGLRAHPRAEFVGVQLLVEVVTEVMVRSEQHSAKNEVKGKATMVETVALEMHRAGAVAILMAIWEAATPTATVVGPVATLLHLMYIHDPSPKRTVRESVRSPRVIIAAAKCREKADKLFEALMRPVDEILHDVAVGGQHAYAACLQLLALLGQGLSPTAEEKFREGNGVGTLVRAASQALDTGDSEETEAFLRALVLCTRDTSNAALPRVLRRPSTLPLAPAAPVVRPPVSTPVVYRTAACKEGALALAVRAAGTPSAVGLAANALEDIDDDETLVASTREAAPLLDHAVTAALQSDESADALRYLAAVARCEELEDKVWDRGVFDMAFVEAQLCDDIYPARAAAGCMAPLANASVGKRDYAYSLGCLAIGLKMGSLPEGASLIAALRNDSPTYFNDVVSSGVLSQWCRGMFPDEAGGHMCFKAGGSLRWQPLLAFAKALAKITRSMVRFAAKVGHQEAQSGADQVQRGIPPFAIWLKRMLAREEGWSHEYLDTTLEFLGALLHLTRWRAVSGMVEEKVDRQLEVLATHPKCSKEVQEDAARLLLEIEETTARAKCEEEEMSEFPREMPPLPSTAKASPSAQGESRQANSVASELEYLQGIDLFRLYDKLTQELVNQRPGKKEEVIAVLKKTLAAIDTY